MRTQVMGCEFTFSRNLHHAFNWTNLHNYLTLAKSRDINGHFSDVIIPLDIGNFPFVVLYVKPSLCGHWPAFFEDIGH